MGYRNVADPSRESTRSDRQGGLLRDDKHEFIYYTLSFRIIRVRILFQDRIRALRSITALGIDLAPQRLPPLETREVREEHIKLAIKLSWESSSGVLREQHFRMTPK